MQTWIVIGDMVKRLVKTLMYVFYQGIVLIDKPKCDDNGQASGDSVIQFTIESFCVLNEETDCASGLSPAHE